MTELELVARAAWGVWGPYAKATTCAGCAEFTRCRARRARGPFLCLECFDLGPEGERTLAELDRKAAAA